MGNVTYTAIESLLPFHVVDETVSMEIGFQQAEYSRRVEKSVQRSLGGAMEVIKHRSEQMWDLEFEPVGGFQLDQLREFLASTEAGEEFSIDAYGNSSSPKSVKRIDEGHAEAPFMRRGAESLDLFVVRIQVIQL